jgi:hypothetical protein
VIGHETDRNDNHCLYATRRELAEMIVDVGLQPWLARRARAGAVDKVAPVMLTTPLSNALRNLGCHSGVPINVCAAMTARWWPGGLGHRGRDRMRNKDELGLVS